jgi:hypothetical protein
MKQVCVAVFLDIQAAYDNADARGIMQKLNNLGLSRNFCLLIWNLMKKRNNHFSINDDFVAVFLNYIGMGQGLSFGLLLLYCSMWI